MTAIDVGARIIHLKVFAVFVDITNERVSARVRVMPCTSQIKESVPALQAGTAGGGRNFPDRGPAGRRSGNGVIADYLRASIVFMISSHSDILT